jgi:hypothetical protein
MRSYTTHWKNLCLQTFNQAFEIPTEVLSSQIFNLESIQEKSEKDYLYFARCFACPGEGPQNYLLQENEHGNPNALLLGPIFNGTIEGWGIKLKYCGRLDIGHHKNHKLDGEGRRYEENGTFYHGCFKEGKFHGYGRYGFEVRGAWKNGKFQKIGSDLRGNEEPHRTYCKNGHEYFVMAN